MSAPYYQDDFVTLYHGDCLTEHREWLDADVLVTDPPYGIPGGRLGRHQKGAKQTHADAEWDRLEIRDGALELWGSKPRLVFGSPKMQEFAPRHRGGSADLGQGRLAWHGRLYVSIRREL